MATGGLIAAGVVFSVVYGTSKNRLWLRLAYREFTRAQDRRARGELSG
jgi:hypothetical protein